MSTQLTVTDWKTFLHQRRSYIFVARENWFENAKYFTLHTCWTLISPQEWQLFETSGKWQLCQRKHKNILGTTSHRTHPFLELMNNTQRRFLWRLKAGSSKKVPTIQQDRVPQFRSSVKSRQYSLEPLDTDTFRNRSGNISKHRLENQEPSGGCYQNYPLVNWSSLPVAAVTYLTQRREKHLNVGAHKFDFLSFYSKFADQLCSSKKKRKVRKALMIYFDCAYVLL